MRTARLLAVGMVAALALHLAQPAFAQATDDAPDTEQAEPADTPAKPKAPPARKPAPKPAPKHAAPAKPVAPAAPPAAETTPSGKPPITAQEVRPPANMLVDCAKAPSDAVTKLPDALARWATVYCTKLGHIFNANDRYFGVFPDTGLRASFSAADLSGKQGEVGNEAFFTKIAYHEMTPVEASALIARDPGVKKILAGKQLWQLDLSAVGGNSLSFVVINPTVDPFWVFPLNDKGLGQPAFFVSSLDALNRAR